MLMDQDVMINLFCGAGLLNSLFLAVYLFTHKPSNLSNRILSFIFVAISIKLGYLFLNYIDLKHEALHMAYAKSSVASYLSLGPLLLLYLHSIKNHLFTIGLRQLIQLTPSLLYLVVPAHFLESYFWNNGGFYFIQGYFLIYLLVAAVHVLELKRENDKANNHAIFKWFAFLFFGICIIWTSVFFKRYNYYPELAAFFSFNLYILLFVLIGNFKSINKKIKNDKDDYCKYNITDAIKAINDIMKEEKPFLQSGFNISAMAELLNMPIHVLSHILNNHYKERFSAFVNRYRIDEVKEKLADADYSDLTIQSVAFDCGFNSLSVFNTAFKKATNKTPTAYRNFHANSFRISKTVR